MAVGMTVGVAADVEEGGEAAAVREVARRAASKARKVCIGIWIVRFNEIDGYGDVSEIRQQLVVFTRS